jgi:hypothetical protein
MIEALLQTERTTGEFGLPDGREKGRDDRLANLELGLERLKAGLGLVGVKPCSWCGVYYGRSDPGALLDCGELVCYDCVPQWWLHRSPGLGVKDRQTVESGLRRWLVTYHHAEVIGHSRKLPSPEQLLMKLVTGCQQCNASGKTYAGARCSYCDGRGTVWVIVRVPDDIL